MKKNKSLIVLLLILIAFIATYVGLTKYNAAKETAELQGNNEPQTIALANYSADKIKTIKYTFEKTTMELMLEGGKWFIKDDTKFPVNQELVSNMISALASLTATRTIESGELSDYGLDEPKISIAATLDDGSTHEYLIGDENSFNSNSYILAGGKIYMFADKLSEYFNADRDSLIKITDALPSILDSSNVISVTLDNGKSKINTITDEDGIAKAVEALKGAVTFKDYKGYGLDENGLKDYGISEEGACVVLKYYVSTGTESKTAATMKICFGTVGKKNYYAIENSDMTYLAADKDYSALWKLIDYQPKSDDSSSS